MSLIGFTTGFLLLASAFSGQGASSSQSTLPVMPGDQAVIYEARYIDHTRREAVAAFVREYFTDAPVLAEIAYCESTYRQLGMNGEVLRGNHNSGDVGVMQINELYHAETAKKMGLSLYDLDDNVAYARYLYEKQGTKPWNSSSACWAKLSDNQIAKLN